MSLESDSSGEYYPPEEVVKRESAGARYDSWLVRTYRTIKQRVRYILAHYPSARDCDAYLIWLYLRIFEGLDMPWLSWKRLQGINFESIRRARQLIQAEGEYPPTNPKVVVRRNRMRRAMSRVIGQRLI